MTDEEKFSKLVAAWLLEQFATIEEDVFLEDEYRWVDFVTSTEFSKYAIEVEDDFDGAIRGTGQAIIYAEALDAEPIVVIPADEVEQPEFDHLDEKVHMVTV